MQIRTAQHYPEDYEALVEQARRERDAGTKPPLAERYADIAPVDTIFLGFSIPGTTKLNRLEENLGCVTLDLSSTELDEINVEAAKVSVVGDRLPEAAMKMTRV